MSFDVTLSDLLGPEADSGLQGRLVALYMEEDGRFHSLVKAAGLDPERDFQRRDLRRLDFLDADLRGYDFTGSDLRGTRLRAAQVDESTRLHGVLVDREDAAWLEDAFGRSPQDDSSLMADLRGSLRRGEMDIVYQPIISFRNAVIERVEALVRWNHPEHGSIAPAVFVPMLEDAGLIDTLAFFVIERAMDDQRKMRAAGFDLRIAVNIASTSLYDLEFVDNCCRLLAGQNARLRFEVTESVLLYDLKILNRNCERLGAVGVDFALDDFGTGYTAIGGLNNFPAVELKIDRSMTNNITEDKSASAIVRSMIDLAHGHGMTVTAEGIEAPAALALLQVLGCDAVQGFQISRLLPLKALLDFLESAPLFVGNVENGIPRANMLVSWIANKENTF